MEQVKTFQNELSHKGDLDAEVNAWLKEAGVKISSIRRDVFQKTDSVGHLRHRYSVLTTIIYKERD